MKQTELKIGTRVYHPIFKFGTVSMPPNKDKTIVDFDFKECSYYIMGQGYKSFKKENGDNLIYLPNDELFVSELNKSELSEKMQLKILALNATVIF